MNPANAGASGRLAGLFRYPVKGLSPERLSSAALTAGEYFPGDRLFAIENGQSGFDAAAPAHQPKIKFLMLMRNERLASLRTRYEDVSDTLVIEGGGGGPQRFPLRSEDGRMAMQRFFEAFMPNELRGEPRLLAAPHGFRFTDSRRGYVSIINQASVAALEDVVDKPVHPLRFRGNLYVEGWPAWSEFDLVGREIRIGSARLKVTSRIERCAATDVDPDTGIRDLSIPRTLMRAFGHTDCGVYAEVIESGTIRQGDRLDTTQAQAALPF
jgi:uncharacterized protein